MSWNIEGRKKNHVDICMNEDVSYHKTTGFENYDFVHNALPDINFEDVSTETTFLKKKLTLPLIISGMTGGPKLSATINTNLAKAAQKTGVAMGVGSERVALEKGEAASFQVRKYAPDIPLLANLGAIQLNNGYDLKECNKALALIDADALVLHLNAMQEVIQQEDTNFKGLLERIALICEKLDKPVIVKEVGFGIDVKTARKLAGAGVYAIDVAGAGGTSWTAVESYVAQPPYDDIGRQFWDWGIPTAKCLQLNRELTIPLIAGGGMRTGIDMAKAIALGADYVSMAGPLLKAALKGEDAVITHIQELQLALKTAMFGIGVSTIDELKVTDRLIKK